MLGHIMDESVLRFCEVILVFLLGKWDILDSKIEEFHVERSWIIPSEEPVEETPDSVCEIEEHEQENSVDDE